MTRANNKKRPRPPLGAGSRALGFRPLAAWRGGLALALALALLAAWPSTVPGHSFNDEEIPEGVKALGEEAVTEWLDREFEKSNALKVHVSKQRAETREEAAKRFTEGVKSRADRMREREAVHREAVAAEMRSAQRQTTGIMFGGFALAIVAAGGWFLQRSRNAQKAAAAKPRMNFKSVPIDSQAIAEASRQRGPKKTAHQGEEAPQKA